MFLCNTKILPLTHLQLSGPVIRITPDEVHLSDPENYEILHSVGTKYAKPASYYGALGAGYSTFVAGPPEIHRPRRAKLDPYFSRQKVISLEHLVQSRAAKLLQIITSRFAEDREVDLYHAFRSVSVDVISDYAFGESYELLEREDLGKEYFDNLAGLGPSWWVFQQWPAVQTFALSLPVGVSKAMNKSLNQILTLLEVRIIHISPFVPIPFHTAWERTILTLLIPASQNPSPHRQSPDGRRRETRKAVYLRRPPHASRGLRDPDARSSEGRSLRHPQRGFGHDWQCNDRRGLQHRDESRDISSFDRGVKDCVPRPG